ncbi:MAG: hypothetical protein JXK93_10335 [Sphaerochaetaceae bacterium]|nr:hypothetical protein [Sphaerochaetaceae bacterium]
MRKTILHRTLAGTAALLLLFTLSCNIDDEGIFYRVSISEPIVEVGAVTVIDFNDANNIIAHTKDAGMQLYNPVTGDWSLISVENSNPIRANLLATDATRVFIGESAALEENNDLYTILKSESSPTGTAYNSAMNVVSMGLYGDVMVVETTTDFEVRTVSSPTSAVTDGTFSTATYRSAQVRAQDDDTFLVLLQKAADDTYSSYLYEGGIRYPVTTDLEQPVRAFFVDSTDQGIFVLGDGSVYRSSDVAATQPTDTANTITLKTTNTEFTFLPVLTNGDALYMQGSANIMYSISMTDGTVASAEDDFVTTLSTVDIISYIADGTNHYAGTVEHGIIEIEFAAVP